MDEECPGHMFVSPQCSEGWQEWARYCAIVKRPPRARVSGACVLMGICRVVPPGGETVIFGPIIKGLMVQTNSENF